MSCFTGSETSSSASLTARDQQCVNQPQTGRKQDQQPVGRFLARINHGTNCQQSERQAAPRVGGRPTMPATSEHVDENDDAENQDAGEVIHWRGTPTPMRTPTTNGNTSMGKPRQLVAAGDGHGMKRPPPPLSTNDLILPPKPASRKFGPILVDSESAEGAPPRQRPRGADLRPGQQARRTGGYAVG